MSDVKWIKITTDIFDNWKLKHLKAVPELGHAFVCVWFELLCMSGYCNESGRLIMSSRFVVTDELIAETFNEDLKIVQMALRMFEDMGMIEVTDNNEIQISNWTEYQSAEKLQIIKEYESEKKAKYRANQKLKIEQKEMSTKMSMDKSTDSSISIYSNSISHIISYLNKLTNKNYRVSNKNTIKHITARINEGFTEDDFYSVIDYKVSQWQNDEKMRDYLRPDTLFGTKFESYLNSAPKRKPDVVTEVVEEEPVMNLWDGE